MPSEISMDDMDDLEDELQTPTGRRTVRQPPLKLNGVLLSQECGILYRLRDAEGLRYDPHTFLLCNVIECLCIKVSVVLPQGRNMLVHSV
jgi:hypothetical protein